MYTGVVEVGGPAAVRTLAGLEITKLAVGPMANNAYLLRCRATGEALLVDAAAEPARLALLWGEIPPKALLTTHRHQDHWGALAEIVQATGARTLAGEHDAEGIEVPTDLLVQHGDTIRVGEAALQAIELRGHTPGSIALAFTDTDGSVHLFVGDCLFPGGIGNTWGDPIAFASLLADVTARLFDRYPDEAWVYPGHGVDTTLGTERPHLAEWAARGW